MLNLQENSDNLFYLTLMDLSELTDPSFFITFKNEQTLEVLQVDVTDESVHPLRYQQFLLSLPTDINLKAGNYLYTAFETDGESTNQLEVGLCRVRM